MKGKYFLWKHFLSANIYRSDRYWKLLLINLFSFLYLSVFLKEYLHAVKSIFCFSFSFSFSCSLTLTISLLVFSYVHLCTCLNIYLLLSKYICLVNIFNSFNIYFNFLIKLFVSSFCLKTFLICTKNTNLKTYFQTKTNCSTLYSL